MKTPEEVRQFCIQKERDTYSLLRMIARTKDVSELKPFGYQSYEAALKGIMERSMKIIEAAVVKFEREHPDPHEEGDEED